jgi:hypothetical protein
MRQPSQRTDEVEDMGLDSQNLLRRLSEPWPSPQTDPTNPYNQESVGIWVANERASDYRVSEPGLTQQERTARKHGGLPSAPTEG